MLEFRKARLEDLPALLSLYKAGQAFQVATGNPHQWPPGYPEPSRLEAEIQTGDFYLASQDQEIVIAFYLMPAPDPTYQVIHDGPGWLNDHDYVAVHRFVTKYPGLGLGQKALDWIQGLGTQIRIDTHQQNGPMRQLLEKAGYAYCGIIYLENGDPRLAYQFRGKERVK